MRITLRVLDIYFDLIAVNSHYGLRELSILASGGIVLECNHSTHDIVSGYLILCGRCDGKDNIAVGHNELKLIAGQLKSNYPVFAGYGYVVLVDSVILIRNEGVSYSGVYLNVAGFTLYIAVRALDGHNAAYSSVLDSNAGDLRSGHSKFILAGLIVEYCLASLFFLAESVGVLNRFNSISLVRSYGQFNLAVCCRTAGNINGTSGTFIVFA